MMLKAFLLGCIAFLGKCDLATGTNQLQRPIILGPLVGLVLGDLDAGIKIGATLELAFLGSYSVGAFIPPNVIVGGVLGTAFAIVTGKGPAVAFTMAFPIALLAVAIDNIFFSLVRPLLGKVADNYAEKGNVHGKCHSYGYRVLNMYSTIFNGIPWILSWIRCNEEICRSYSSCYY